MNAFDVIHCRFPVRRPLADRPSRVRDCGRPAPLPVAGPPLSLVQILAAGQPQPCTRARPGSQTMTTTRGNHEFP